MSVAHRAAALVLGACALLLSACASGGTALLAGTVYRDPQSPPLKDGVILMRGGRIEAVGSRAEVRVPRGYQVVERPSAVAVAGFWNSHVHLISPELARAGGPTSREIEAALGPAYARWGFTTVVDLASATSIAVPIARRIEAERLAAPRVLTVGEPFYPDGGTPIYAKPIYEALNLPSAEVATPAEAAERVERQITGGASAIKIFTGAIVGGAEGVRPLPLPIAREIVAAAHARRAAVFAHPTNREGLDIAVNAGVDVLAHAAPLTGPWDEAYARDLAERGVGLAPTLLLFKLHPHPDTPVSVAQQQVRALASAGGDILFGTDAGFMEVFDPTGEYELMGEVLDWRRLLAALTTTPARRLGEADRRGRLAEGFAADLVLLGRDPAEGPHAFAAVLETWRAGRRIHASAAGPEAPAPSASR